MAVSGVKTLAFIRAVKKPDIEDIHVSRKQYIGTVDNVLRYVKVSAKDCLLTLASDIDVSIIIIIYYCKGFKPEEAEVVADILRHAVSPDLEATEVSGSQPIYAYLISVE